MTGLFFFFLACSPALGIATVLFYSCPLFSLVLEGQTEGIGHAGKILCHGATLTAQNLLMVEMTSCTFPYDY